MSDEQLAWTEEEQAAMLRVHEHFMILSQIAAERKQAIDAIEELERRAIAEIQRISEKEVAAERESGARKPWGLTVRNSRVTNTGTPTHRTISARRSPRRLGNQGIRDE